MLKCLEMIPKESKRRKVLVGWKVWSTFAAKFKEFRIKTPENDMSRKRKELPLLESV